MTPELRRIRKAFAGNVPAERIVGNVSELTQNRRGPLYSEAQGRNIERSLAGQEKALARAIEAQTCHETAEDLKS